MKKRALLYLLILFAAAGTARVTPAQAETASVTVGDFVGRMLKAAHIRHSGGDRELYAAAAAAGLLKDGQKTDLRKRITKAEAAQIAEKADELLHGSRYDEALYRCIKEKRRIHDLNSIPAALQDAVIKVYAKGIMVGEFRGMFTSGRDFKGKEGLSDEEAKTIAVRVKYPEKRKNLSPDGQLIRTEKLPANADDYEYILANLPNSFYEKRFGYQKTKYYYKPVELKDYASPKRIKKAVFNVHPYLTEKEVMEKYLYDWCAMVEKNLKLRFNVDYRTIDNEWISELRSTYFDYKNASDNKPRTDDIKEYVKNMKKNKVIVKASRIVAEPSSLYLHSGEVIRVYVKFKVVSGKVKSVKGRENVGGTDISSCIYSDSAYVEKYRKGSWMEKYFDIGIGTVNGRSTGNDYTIVNNDLYELLE